MYAIPIIVISVIFILWLLFKKKIKPSSSIVENDTEDTNIETDEIISLLEKYGVNDDEELYTRLEAKELNDEELTDLEKKFLEDEACVQLGRIFHSEHIHGRSLAVKELVNFRYQVFPNEYENPFKELINFTLKYFKNLFDQKPEEASNLLVLNFPTLHIYIIRQIMGQENTTIGKYNINEQEASKAYDEFLVFCKNVFISSYPDKAIRDKQIKIHFKIFHNDLIAFVDKDNI